MQAEDERILWEITHWRKVSALNMQEHSQEPEQTDAEALNWSSHWKVERDRCPAYTSAHNPQSNDDDEDGAEKKHDMIYHFSH